MIEYPEKIVIGENALYLDEGKGYVREDLYEEKCKILEQQYDKVCQAYQTIGAIVMELPDNSEYVKALDYFSSNEYDENFKIDLD